MGAALGFALAACVPDLQEGHYGCQSNADCPEEWYCWSDGRCYASAEVPASDGGARDGMAGPDATLGMDAAAGSDAALGDQGARDVGSRDSGPPADVGVQRDASVASDASTSPDTGVNADGGGPTDAGPSACTCTSAPNNFVLGVVTSATDPCPIGFAADTTNLFAFLDPGAGCEGNCSCTPQATNCLGQLFIYANPNQCQADVTLTGGVPYGSLLTEQCTNTPVADGGAGGYRLGAWTVEQSCLAAGTAAPSPYRWGSEAKFCAASLGATSCATDEACIDTTIANATCVITAGGAACPAPYTERITQWFTGLSDTRSCGTCECRAFGGSCEFAQIAIGSDWVCTDDVYLSQQNPQSCGSAYSPPARVTGWPTDPSCEPSSPLSGSIQATGQQTLCCRP